GLQRGGFLTPGAVVAPRVPPFRPPPHPHGARGVSEGHPAPSLPLRAPPRLDFARWLADRDSPTTARVLVNRVWQAYFGTGIVATSENLGTQSDAPSHPELLDWLAVELMEKGWSLKTLHRLIVTSATYRQSSKVTPALYQRD